MRILIDIGHPAHVHYFRNFISIMSGRGHEFHIVARDKEITFELLDHYSLPYVNRGKGGQGLVGKLFYLLQGDLILYQEARKFKPDLFLSFASSYAAQASWFYGKPHIALDDTEHSKMELLLYPPFTEKILTPFCFKLDLGLKHIRFNSFMELFHLHPNYFTPNKQVLNQLGVSEGEPYAIVRFVSWGASHDRGIERMTELQKIDLVKNLSKRIRVFISSESQLPDSLKQFEFNLPSYLLHDALFFASIYIGEGATTASEAVMLGTPAVYTNALGAGTLSLEEDAGMLNQVLTFDDIQQAINRFLKIDVEEIRMLHKKFIGDFIDPTEMLVDFVESNYGVSARH